MKHERLYTFLIAGLLAFGLTLGSLGCFITGCGIPLVSFRRILLLWAVTGAVLSGILCRSRGTGTMVCLLALAAGYFWQQGQLILETKSLIARLGTLYGRAYGFSFPYFRPEAGQAPFADYPIAGYGIALIALVCISVCRRGKTAPAVLAALLPLGLSMVITDTVPEKRMLFLLLLCLTLLVLAGTPRRESASQGNRLTLIAALPTALALGMLFLLIPQETYINRAKPFQETLLAHMEQVPAIVQGSGVLYTLPEGPQPQIDLSTLKGQSPLEKPVLIVTAEESGPLYLRGQDYDIYTGKEWEASSGRQESFGGWGEKMEDITIQAVIPQDVLFLPYFPGSGTTLWNGRVTNSSGEQVYTLPRYAMGSAVGEENLEINCALPESTAAGLQNWVPVMDSSSLAATVDSIGSFLRSHVPYDRETGRMPLDEGDFALWFLNSAESGYCVHYATAATLLLRAAGIPARYVTGYLAEARAGEPVILMAKDAHAWAEYYDGDTGMWRILEATPSAEPEVTVPDEAAVPTEVSIPAKTEETTLPPLTAEPAELPEDLPSLRILTLFLGTLCLLLIFRRQILLYLVQWQRNRQCTNDRALLLWREAERFAAQLEEEPPQALSELVEKARFSQHTLTPEELQPFADYRRQCRRQLQKKPWYYQLVYRYIYVLY